MSDYIPQDVLIDILTRLPAETLVRLTSVCKSWRSLITSPNFISHHLNRNANNDSLLVHCCNERPNQELYTLILDGNNSIRHLKTFDFPLTTRSSDFFSVVGSCNGLICLSDDDQGGNMDDIYLWNPSIRKSVALPTYNVRVESHGPAMQCLGFGFDSVTDDFKVVRVVHVYEGEGCYWVPPEVEIYTLKTGNWRCISDKALPAMISKRYRQAYVNGVAHWMAYSQATQAAEFQPTILPFDMSGVVFNEILVPDSMDHGEFLLKSTILVVFKESLSLIEQCDCDCDCDCDYYPRCTVWIMKEYGVATSWAKLFRIDLCEGLRNPLGLRKNSEVIFETCDGNLVSCDRQCEIMGIHGTLGNICSLWHTFCIDTYAESLVLLN